MAAYNSTFTEADFAGMLNVFFTIVIKHLAEGKEVHIYRVTSLKDDASESSSLELSAGKVFRLHGRNLSFNLEDEQQGVFLENETSQLRVASYIRRGTNIIDIAVPSELTAGKYSISVVTKPGTIYFTGTTESMITVS